MKETEKIEDIKEIYTFLHRAYPKSLEKLLKQIHNDERNKTIKEIREKILRFSEKLESKASELMMEEEGRTISKERIPIEASIDTLEFVLKILKEVEK